MMSECPGCKGQVRGLPLKDQEERGVKALCQCCGREPIEYHRLKADVSLRDQMAMAALTGILASPPRMDSPSEEVYGIFSHDAYMFADAMLAERDKKPLTGIDPAKKTDGAPPPEPTPPPPPPGTGTRERRPDGGS